MTTVTTTPFVNTPFGVGVVEVLNDFSWAGQAEGECYIRFEDGSREWVPIGACALDAPRPDWYREPETDLIAGWVS